MAGPNKTLLVLKSVMPNASSVFKWVVIGTTLIVATIVVPVWFWAVPIASLVVLLMVLVFVLVSIATMIVSFAGLPIMLVILWLMYSGYIFDYELLNSGVELISRFNQTDQFTQVSELMKSKINFFYEVV